MFVITCRGLIASETTPLSSFSCFSFIAAKWFPSRIKSKLNHLISRPFKAPIAAEELETVLHLIPETEISLNLRPLFKDIKSSKPPQVHLHWKAERGASRHSFSGDIRIDGTSGLEFFIEYVHERFHSVQSPLEINFSKQSKYKKIEATVQLEREAYQFQLDVMNALKRRGIPCDYPLFITAEALKSKTLYLHPTQPKKSPAQIQGFSKQDLVQSPIRSESELINSALEGVVFYIKKPD